MYMKYTKIQDNALLNNQNLLDGDMSLAAPKQQHLLIFSFASSEEAETMI